MIRENLNQYFTALEQMKQEGKFNMRAAWEFLIAQFGLTPIKALEVVDLFSDYCVRNEMYRKKRGLSEVC